MRTVVAVLAVLGATVLNVWLSRLTLVPTAVLAVTWVGCYVAIAVMVWWPRWKAAWTAFWLTNKGSDTTSRRTDQTCKSALAVQRTAAVLREAAAYAREVKPGTDTGIIVRFHMKALSLLDAGFHHRIKQDFDVYWESEKRKLDGSNLEDTSFDGYRVIATYFEELADRLTAEDLDERFLIPDSFQQYMWNEWPSSSS